MDIMQKSNWKIIYSNYDGIEKSAINFISREMGKYVLRNMGEYSLPVLAIEKFDVSQLDKNAVIIGLYGENTLIQKYIKKDEIPENGYIVKVFDNPENEELKIAIIAANEPVNVFYGAADFIDDYFSFAIPERADIKYPKELFEGKMPDYKSALYPTVKTRNVFAWGHPITNYKEYLENMARMKLNQLILWNDFAPLNKKEFTDCAHSFGISVMWGYAWGWSLDCSEINLEALDKVSDAAIEKFEKEYAKDGVDGIYFQSFTELEREKIGDKLIAEAVTDFVNSTAEKLLEKFPGLHIQFGLHATSVKDRLEFIAKVDKRVEIIWENSGSFPYNNSPFVKSEKDYEETKSFTEKIINLREEGAFGMLYKGQLRLDWSKFMHQAGPYIIGDASAEGAQHDREMYKPLWKHFQNNWIKNGRYAYDMTKYIVAKERKDVTLGMAGQFAGGRWFSQALCAEIIYNCDRPYEEIFSKVSARHSVDMV